MQVTAAVARDPDVFLPKLIAHWKADRLPVEKLVKTFPFAEINAAIAAIAAQHHGDCVKVVLSLAWAGLRARAGPRACARV